jgi:hypothetical protein
MVTEGHWWSDRVELFSDELQRSRLGGLALRRNQFVPGYVVSWRFPDPNGAEKLAILVPGPLPTKFKVIAYNLDDKRLPATMTGWDVAPGARPSAADRASHVACRVRCANLGREGSRSGGRSDAGDYPAQQ